MPIERIMSSKKANQDLQVFSWQSCCIFCMPNVVILQKLPCLSTVLNIIPLSILFLNRPLADGAMVINDVFKLPLQAKLINKQNTPSSALAAAIYLSWCSSSASVMSFSNRHGISSLPMSPRVCHTTWYVATTTKFFIPVMGREGTWNWRFAM